MTKNKSYFQMQLNALRICGISLRDNESMIYKIVSKIVILYVCAYPFLAAGDLFKHDFDTVAELLTYEFPLFIAVIKTMALLLNRKKIVNVLNQLDGNISLQNSASGNSKTEQLMRTCILINTGQTAVYWIFAFFAYIFATMYTLSTRIRSNDYHDWQLTYGTITVLDITRSPSYEITWGYQTTAVGFIGILYTTIDLLIAGALCHVCFHLRILQENLIGIVADIQKKKEHVSNSNMYTTMQTANSNEDEFPTVDWNNLHAAIEKNVGHHLAIINIIKEVNESFSSSLLLVFLGALGMMSFLAYKASLIPLNDIRMLRGLAELSTAILQVLLVCFWSEEMIFDGKQIGYAAYAAFSVGTDLRFQKSLILIMRRSQYPIRLTAGFFEVSLSTFTWILRSTYSYYMILRKRNLREN